MKRYSVKITDKVTKKVLHEGDEISNTSKQIETKYTILFPFSRILIKRMKK